MAVRRSRDIEADLRQTLDSLGGDVERALDEINVPAYIIDAKGTIRWANEASRRVLGADIVGLHYSQLVDPADRRKVREEFARAVFGAGPMQDFAFTVVTPGGKRFRTEKSPVRLKSGGRVVGIFGIAHYEPLEQHRGEPHPHLTPRQHEVLRLLAQGRSTAQIAAELGIAVETARNHIRMLLRRLHSHSRLEAVMRAHRVGLLSSPAPLTRSS